MNKCSSKGQCLGTTPSPSSLIFAQGRLRGFWNRRCWWKRRGTLAVTRVPPRENLPTSRLSPITPRLPVTVSQSTWIRRDYAFLVRESVKSQELWNGQSGTLIPLEEILHLGFGPPSFCRFVRDNLRLPQTQNGEEAILKVLHLREEQECCWCCFHRRKSYAFLRQRSSVQVIVG